MSAAELDALREREAYWLARLGGVRGAGRGRGPGPLRPRVGGAAGVRGRARGADHRRPADLRRRRRRRPPRPPGALPDRRPGRRAARQVHRHGPALGQPALRLARAAPAQVPLVGRAAAAHLAAWSTSRGSTTSAASSPTGRCRRAPPTRAAATGRGGRDAALFDAIRAELGDLPLVAENLGEITPPVERLRHELGLPGMAVMQFAFDPDEPQSPYKLARHEENDVVYTGTHDHDTARGWCEDLGRRVPRRVRPRSRRAPGSRSPSPGGPWSASPCRPAAASR